MTIPSVGQATEGNRKTMARSVRAQSRITNGKRLLPTADWRHTWPRIVHAVIGRLEAHLGGPDTITEPQRLIARRVAVLEAELIFIEDGLANKRASRKEPTIAELDIYSRLGNAQRRHLETLGVEERKLRDITPSVSEYLRALTPEATEDDPA
jgi:hypothetical protein